MRPRPARPAVGVAPDHPPVPHQVHHPAAHLLWSGLGVVHLPRVHIRLLHPVPAGPAPAARCRPDLLPAGGTVSSLSRVENSLPAVVSVVCCAVSVVRVVWTASTAAPPLLPGCCFCCPVSNSGQTMIASSHEIGRPALRSHPVVSFLRTPLVIF